MNLLKYFSNPVSIYFLEVMESPEDQCVESVQSPDAHLAFVCWLSSQKISIVDL